MAAEPFDVVVIGSGAAGGTAAYVLTKAGARVCVIEAGRNYDPAKETPMFNTNREAPLRGVGTPDKPFGFYDATVDGGWDIPGEPYASAPGAEFRWWRARMLGGRTNHWGRISLRFAEHDFKGFTADGHGVDWPVGYAEMAPWYDKAERFIGVTGETNGLDDQPDSPDGVLLPIP
jgi:choline dehydrogenase-like flavoprotein